MAVLAMESSSPGWLLTASIFVGFGQGMGNFLRFSAAEIVPSAWSAQGITYVMITGVFAAIVGPLSGTVLEGVLPTKFMGSFLAYLCFAVLNLLMLLITDFTPYNVQRRKQLGLGLKSVGKLEVGQEGAQPQVQVQVKEQEQVQVSLWNKPDAAAAEHAQHSQYPERTLTEVVCGRMFIFAVAVATTSQVTMIVPMQSLEVSMTQEYGYSFPQSSLVMILHILSSFAFGPVSGYLLSNYSNVTVVCMSVAFNMVAYTLMLSSSSMPAFLFGMILLGCAWNLGYSAGSVLLLCTCFSDEDNLLKQVQATNDTLMLSITAVVTVFTGVEEGKVIGGWHKVLYFGGTFVLLFALLGAFIWQYKSEIAPLRRENEDHNAAFSGEGFARRTSMASHFVFQPPEDRSRANSSVAPNTTANAISRPNGGIAAEAEFGSGPLRITEGSEGEASCTSTSTSASTAYGTEIFVTNPMRQSQQT